MSRNIDISLTGQRRTGTRAEIERLRAERDSLKADCERWRSLAQERLEASLRAAQERAEAAAQAAAKPPKKRWWRRRAT